MNVNAYTPTAVLEPFVQRYLLIESQAELVNRVLPDTSVAMAFRYRGEVNYVSEYTKKALPVSVVSGLRTSVRLINYTKNTGNILVIFKMGGASAFFKAPLNELFEDSIPLDNLVNRQAVSIIEEQLAETTNDGQRIAIIERFLLSRLHNPRPDKLIASALQLIHSTNGNNKMKDLARSLYISQDAFEKRFRKTVGASPKRFSSIVRMKSVIRNYPHDSTLTQMAHAAGYFDQPHFNKEFKLFTGQVPTDFFKSPPAW